MGMCNKDIKIDAEEHGFKPIDPGKRRPKEFKGDLKQKMQELFEEIPLNDPIKFLDPPYEPADSYMYHHDYRYFIYNHAFMKIDAKER